MKGPHVVIGCPVKNRAWVLKHWINAIYEQGIDVKIVCLLSPSEDETESILRQGGVEIIHDTEVGRTASQIDTHLWKEDGYAYMARTRNRLKEWVLNYGADVFFSLDSDIILPENGLATLLTSLELHGGVVAPAVNMALNDRVWNMMAFTGTGAERNPPDPRFGPVDAVMAAMIMDKDAMQCDWTGHPRGEDIGFCLNAERLGITRWWEPAVRCTHLMRKCVL